MNETEQRQFTVKLLAPKVGMSFAPDPQSTRRYYADENGVVLARPEDVQALMRMGCAFAE
jgi:hypothetical protein